MFYFSSSILANSWLVLHFPGSSLPAVSAAPTGSFSRMSHQWSRGLLCLSAHCQDTETHKMTSSRPRVCMFLHKESESDHLRVESWPDLQQWGLCSQPGEMQPGWGLSENNENEGFFTADTGSHWGGVTEVIIWRWCGECSAACRILTFGWSAMVLGSLEDPCLFFFCFFIQGINFTM